MLKTLNFWMMFQAETRLNQIPHFFSSLIVLFKMDVVKDFLGGFSGGALSTLLLHPFDLVRNRQAVADGKGQKMIFVII